MKDLKICNRCIYDSDVPGVSFDDIGVCNYCKQIEDMEVTYQTGKSGGEMLLKDILEKIKETGKGKKYNCVIGVSGGTDSSYLLIKALEWGLKPLAVHYDNTWNTAIALGGNNSIVTAVGNDYSYNDIFSRELGALGKKGDVFIPISTSGNSPNIINAIKIAIKNEITVLGLTGSKEGKITNMCECICVPSDSTPRIQEAHILIGHTICELVEEFYFKR